MDLKTLVKRTKAAHRKALEYDPRPKVRAAVLYAECRRRVRAGEELNAKGKPMSWCAYVKKHFKYSRKTVDDLADIGCAPDPAAVQLAIVNNKKITNRERSARRRLASLAILRRENPELSEAELEDLYKAGGFSRIHPDDIR